jgi:hypothetical protein
MSRSIRSIAVALAFVGHLGAGAAPASAADREGTMILQPRTYHGDEVPAGADGEWWCLAWDGLSARLERCAARVERVRDVVGDDDTGKKVTVGGDRAILVMIRGVPELAAGPVPTLFLGYPGLGPGDWLPLGAGADTGLLPTLRFHFEPSEGHEGRHRLVVSDDGRTQVLADDMRFDTEKGGRFLWVGDLDRDGRPDLLLDTADHYNVTQLTLYLSGCADEGHLVCRVAVRRSVGC